MNPSQPPITLDTSYHWCEHVARIQAKNFYYSFLLLSREQRRAMCAIYAFMRYCDDLSDEISDDPNEDQSAAGRAELERLAAGADVIVTEHAGLAAALARGDRRALSRMLSRIDRRDSAAIAALYAAQASPDAPVTAQVIGITGAPGAGESVAPDDAL